MNQGKGEQDELGYCQKERTHSEEAVGEHEAGRSGQEGRETDRPGPRPDAGADQARGSAASPAGLLHGLDLQALPVQGEPFVARAMLEVQSATLRLIVPAHQQDSARETEHLLGAASLTKLSRPD